MEDNERKMIQLADKASCTGCTACVNICPNQCLHMNADANGFLMPELVFPDKCINCAACQNVCPVLKPKEMTEKNTISYAAYTKDKNIREESSSGGIFSELAAFVINQRGIVFGAAYDADFTVKHISVDTIEQLAKLRGAKYVQSRLDNCFAKVRCCLNQGQLVLFSGLPCQIAGLKSFLKKDYDNLICADFVCHGVPSPMVWSEYVKYRMKKDSNGVPLQSINFRSKKSGWSRYRYSNVFSYTDGTNYSCVSGKDLFMRLFVNDYISRESCSNCQFKGYNRISDITMGDFWGVWDIAPEMDDDKGTSIVLLHSEKGVESFNNIKKRLIYKLVTLEQSSQQNPSMLKSSPENVKRAEVFRKIRNGEMDSLENEMLKMPESKISFKSKLIQKIKKILK